ncbi:ATP-binding cassette domain-containing protein [Herbaspirillum sp. RV1423]|uniref:ABC transporter ATP-binding protein n=1 Tax=Herbaspirillum sp. RV1423 TaxID=1443993 RepID=UPI0004BB231A|nr:ATP-binding cassette domain-containing protein [Herbaspirillum sp. RV1423]
MTSPTILQATHLTFNYPERELFNDLSLDILAGVTLIRGGDGRGKTSLIHLLAGELQAHSGRLAINGISLDEQSAQYKQQVYYVDPRTEAFDQMTVPEYFASVRARFPDFDDAALPALLEGLSLTPHVEKKLFMLSTGSKRKVYLAGAFAAGAAVNLLDDPFAGLDKGSINFVCRTLNDIGVRSAWVASFYETPGEIASTGIVDLGD